MEMPHLCLSFACTFAEKDWQAIAIHSRKNERTRVDVNSTKTTGIKAMSMQAKYGDNSLMDILNKAMNGSPTLTTLFGLVV